MLQQSSLTIANGPAADAIVENEATGTKFVCSDGVNSSWELTMRKKVPSTSGRKSAIPAGHWYICGTSEDHDKDGISQPPVNKNELKMLDGFKQFLQVAFILQESV